MALTDSVRRPQRGVDDDGNPTVGPVTGPDGQTPAPEGPAQPTAHHGSERGRSDLYRAVALVLALTFGLSLVLALFIGVAVNSGPNGVRLAVVGPPPAAAQIEAALTTAAGPDAFEVSVVGDEAMARAALADRTADGAIVIGTNGPTVLTASAGSPAVAQLLTAAAGRLAEPTGNGPPVVDVVALPATDSRGVGLAAGSFPMIIAGLVLGAASALALGSSRSVLGAAVGGAAAIGLSFAGVLTWLGVSGGHFWAEAAAITLTIGTSALVVAGAVRMIGAAGAGLGALLLVIIGNPLSGIATSPRLLPGPWGTFGQWLPTGAGGSLVRTVSYFPEASITAPLVVLLLWAGLGALGVVFGRAGGSQRRSGLPAPTAPESKVVHA